MSGKLLHIRQLDIDRDFAKRAMSIIENDRRDNRLEYFRELDRTIREHKTNQVICLVVGIVLGAIAGAFIGFRLGVAL